MHLPLRNEGWLVSGEPELVLELAEDLVEDREDVVHLWSGDGERRLDLHDISYAAVAAGTEDDPPSHRPLVDLDRLGDSWFLRRAVADELDPDHQAGASDIADKRMASGQLPQAR